jgi:tetratricopeptide (TPR) repeat protein
LCALAILLQDNKQFEEALSCSQRALKIMEMASGTDSPDLFLALRTNTESLYGLKLFDEAESVCRRALPIIIKYLGSEHPDQIYFLRIQSKIYNIREDYKNVVATLQRACSLAEKAYGTEDFRYLRLESNLSAYYVSERKFDDAQPILDRILPLLEKGIISKSWNHIYPDQEHILAESLFAQGTIYFSKDDKLHARPLLDRTLDLMERLYGSDDPSLALVLYRRACVSDVSGLKNARAMLERSVKISLRENPNAPLAAAGFKELSYIYVMEFNFDKAEAAIQQAINIVCSFLNPDHYSVVEMKDFQKKIQGYRKRIKSRKVS